MDADALERRASEALDPELEGLKRKYREEFKLAFHAALAKLTDRERNLLRYELVGNLSIDEIAKLYDVHRATLARWRAAAREKLFVETERSLRTALGIGATDFRSIVRWIDSELDVSLSRVLGANEG
jgi:RNA polymerase sigma-70 factor (ECF subfamily)